MRTSLRKLALGAAVLAASFTPLAAQTTIFSDTFEATTFGTAWTRSGTSNWRVALSTTYKAAGTRGVAFDDSLSDTVFSTSRLDLRVNLANRSNVVLTFKFRNVGEEAHTQDGLYLSTNNGTSFSKVAWTLPAIGTTWSTQTVNLSTAAANLGLTLGSQTVIRWQQYDNVPLSSDGFAIDDVTVTGNTVTPTPTPSPSPSATPTVTPTATPVAPSARAGIGPIIYSGGTAFRVWAPNASAVAVAGQFNSWNATSLPLASEGNGWWSRDVAGAVVGQTYKYVITHPTYGTFWRQDPRALDMTNSAGESVIPDLAHTWVNGFTMPGWNEMVIYQMHVGTYNDAVGGPVGTFDSVTARLDHVQSLGANAIKLMPIMEFPGDLSWGYNPHSQYAPESAYGTPKDLKELVDAAHGRGIAVLLDVVYNHMGTSPTEGDIPIWNFDGESYGNGGIYFYSDWRKQTPWGWSRPDYGRGEVRSYLRDSALYWLNEYRMDGLRWDSTVNIRTQNNGTGGDIPDGWSLMQWINNEIDAASAWKISIAEDLQNNEWLSKSTGSGGAGFDSQWDARFVHPIRTAVITANDADRNMFAVRDAIVASYNGQATQRVIYTESHDEVNNGRSRVAEEIWPGNAGSWYSKKRSTLGGGIVMTSPGIPMMFMGQEMLEDGFWSDADPLDWNKSVTYGGIISQYRDMIRLRRNWYNNTRGLRGNNTNVHHINNTSKVIAYHRWDVGGPGDDVIIVANFSGTGFSSYNVGFPRGGTWFVRFNGDWNGYSSDYGNWNAYNTNAVSGAKDGMGFNANVGVGPYTMIILSQ